MSKTATTTRTTTAAGAIAEKKKEMRMSKAGEEGDEDVECFHDSLDRLLSSSNTSCSCSRSSSFPPSDNEAEDDRDPVSRAGSPDRVPVPRFPKGVSDNYDVWTSQPFSSVEERRLRLLRQMGLSRDPSLLRRRRPSLSFSSSSPTDATRPGSSRRSADSDRLSGETLNNDNNYSIQKHNARSNNSSSYMNSKISNNNKAIGFIGSKSNGDCNSSCKNPEIRLVNSSISALPYTKLCRLKNYPSSFLLYSVDKLFLNIVLRLLTYIVSILGKKVVGLGG